MLAWKGAVVANQRWIALAKADRKLAPMLAEWQELTKRLVQGAGRPEVTDSRDAVSRGSGLMERREQLEVNLKQSLTSRDKVALEHRRSKDLMTILPPQVAVVDFLEYAYMTPARGLGKGTKEQRFAAFVLRHGLPVQRINLGPAADIERAIAEWRVAVGADAVPPGALAKKEENSCAAELRRLLWVPLARALEGCSAILVSPDGALAGFPLGALPGEQKQYLIEERRIALVPVPRVLPELWATGAHATSHGSLLLVTTGEVAKPSLSEAVTVLDTVERGFRAAHPDAAVERLVGHGATGSEFLRHAPSSRILFLMVHGFYDQPVDIRTVTPPPTVGTALHRPRFFPTATRDESVLPVELWSGIELAGRRLTAAEVGQMDLSGTDLVARGRARRPWGCPSRARVCWACSRHFTPPAPAPWCPACGRYPRTQQRPSWNGSSTTWNREWLWQTPYRKHSSI